MNLEKEGKKFKSIGFLFLLVICFFVIPCTTAFAMDKNEPSVHSWCPDDGSADIKDPSSGILYDEYAWNMWPTGKNSWGRTFAEWSDVEAYLRTLVGSDGTFYQVS